MAKWPIDKIIVSSLEPGGKPLEFVQFDKDLDPNGQQVGLNVEVTPGVGYLITRDWPQERDADELSLYARESRTLIEKYYLRQDGEVIIRVAQSTDWEPVKESRRLQKSNSEIKQPDSAPKQAPFMTMAVPGRAENES